MKSSLLFLMVGFLFAVAACQPQPAEEEVPQVEEIETEPVTPPAATDTMMMQPQQPTDTMMMDTMSQM